jgi:hypothetical protein
MTNRCQQLAHAPQQNRVLFDEFVGAGEQRRRQCENDLAVFS